MIRGSQTKIRRKEVSSLSVSVPLFTTVGSWSSTVEPLSLPFILTIASYPASRLMMRASDGKEGRKLPTPYQIALILRVMSNSSLSSVWQCMNYISAKGRRAPMSSALNIMMCTHVLGTIQRALVQSHDEGEHRYAYVTSPAYHFQTDIDYVATKFVVKMNCTPATSRCFKNRHFPDVTSYKCDIAMDGPIDKTMSFLTLTDFTDSTLSSNPNDTYHNSNPHNFAAILNMGFGFAPSGYADNDEVYSGPDQPTVIIMLCESTVFDTEYGSANGSVTHFSTIPSNFSSTNVIVGTLRFSPAMEYFLMHNTITDFWEKVAQRRSSILVAAVPVAPLVCLLVANVLVVLLATVLTVGALTEVTKSDEVGDVQTRLGIDALVATHFETRGKKPGVRKIEDLFEEYQGGDGPRVKVEKTTEEG
ncbi:hypothetical protein H0G86_004095 [Trichoderma simmonsii]|uniref:Uncharacterized protein n=1 Tax=Trichoderma simmonsii TaxID=1491479 RepID=A0A8G0LBW9_9HYPO|nr:hypothetical protein H0G86_004095 [Trichoderma simmonsii]